MVYNPFYLQLFGCICDINIKQVLFSTCFSLAVTIRSTQNVQFIFKYKCAQFIRKRLIYSLFSCFLWNKKMHILFFTPYYIE